MKSSNNRTISFWELPSSVSVSCKTTTKKTAEQINLAFSCHTHPNSLHPWSSTNLPLKHSRKTKSFPFGGQICARLLSGGLIVWTLQGFCNPTPTWRIIPWRTDTWLISMVIVSPQNLGLRDPFQMASTLKGVTKLLPGDGSSNPNPTKPSHKTPWFVYKMVKGYKNRKPQEH